MFSYNLLIPLLFLIFLIVFISLFISFSKITYKINEKDTFSFRNHFAYELNYQSNLKIVSYLRLIVIFLFAICLTINCLFVTSFRGNTSNLLYSLAIGLFFIFGCLVDLILFFLRPNYLRYFKIYSILSFVFALMSNGMLGVICFTSIFSNIIYKVFGGFAFALMALNIVLMLNPKLKDWAKLEKITNKDGSISYARPKISPLAFSIWISFASLLGGEMLICIIMLISSLNV